MTDPISYVPSSQSEEELAAAKVAEEAAALKAKRDAEYAAAEAEKQATSKAKAEEFKVKAEEMKVKNAETKQKCLDEATAILTYYGGLESNIPHNHSYWGLMNAYRGL